MLEQLLITINELKATIEILDAREDCKEEVLWLAISFQRLKVLADRLALEKFESFTDLQNHPQALFAKATAQNALEEDEAELRRLLESQ